MRWEPCQIVNRSQQKGWAIPIEIPSRPWQKLGVDIFFQGGKCYLLIADYYLKFQIVHSLPPLTSTDVISATSSSILVFGIPNEIISNNGSQFVIKEYHDFADRYGFKLTTSSPHYPRCHGFIRRQVQTIKNVLNRCAKDGTDANLALLQLRAIPLDSRTLSLANCCKTGNWRLPCLQSSDLHPTMKLSVPHSSQDRSTAGILHMLRSSHSSCLPSL